MPPARLALAPAALAAGLGVVALIPEEARLDPPSIAAVLAVGWCFVATGLIAWERRPENVIGRIMVLTGFAVFAGRLHWSTEPAAFTLGILLESAYLLGVGYVLLAFPSGRLHSRLERAILALAVIVVGPLQLAWMALGMGDEQGCACPANLVELTSAPQLSEAIVRFQQVLGGLLTLATVWVLVRRWRGASPALRFAIAPVLWSGTLAFGLVAVRLVNDLLDEPAGGWLDWFSELAAATVALAFLAGLLRTRLARGGVARLVVDLDESAGEGGLRDALARALRDPTLEIAYWLPGRGTYADAAGHPVRLPDRQERTVTVVERDGRRIAALVHDRATEDPELVRSVSAAAALALDNQRLQAELRARLDELTASRGRIVQAAQEERRRIERNLHDGTQQRLVSLAMTLGLADARLATEPAAARPIVREARRALADTLDELRELSQGIHPGLLTERGLAPALEELGYRAGLPLHLEVSLGERLSEDVEAAVYFLVSEALANVAKHARATGVTVTVRRDGAVVAVEIRDDGVGGADGARGSGLRGLADRVEALGGRLDVESPSGGGTAIRAQIPCA
jgi:signal transduction histidine kinase